MRSEIEKWQLSIHTHVLNPWLNALTTYTIHHSFYVTLMCRQTSEEDKNLMLQCCISAQFLRLEFFLSLSMYLILDNFPQRFLSKTWEPIWYEKIVQLICPSWKINTQVRAIFSSCRRLLFFTSPLPDSIMLVFEQFRRCT